MLATVKVVLAILVLLAVPIAVSATTQPQGVPERESDGDLEDVGLNREVFNTGDLITISGSIEDPTSNPFIKIEVIDPEGQTVARNLPKMTADQTFVYSFEAGDDEIDRGNNTPMKVAGNYRVVVTYNSPGLGRDEVDLEFK